MPYGTLNHESKPPIPAEGVGRPKQKNIIQIQIKGKIETEMNIEKDSVKTQENYDRPLQSAHINQ